jgi:hypothetical protein
VEKDYNKSMVAGMDTSKTIRKFTSHEEQKAEINRYWRSKTAGERFAAAWEATAAAYAFKGTKYDPTRRSEATLTLIQRARG